MRTPPGQETISWVCISLIAGALANFNSILTVSNNTAVSSSFSPRSWDDVAGQLWLTLSKQGVLYLVSEAKEVRLPTVSAVFARYDFVLTPKGEKLRCPGMLQSRRHPLQVLVFGH